MINEQTVRAYLWQDAIRLGFSPASKKDQKIWLHQYGQSLKEFWGIDCYPNPPSDNKSFIIAEISCLSTLDLHLEYAVESSQKFSVRFSYNQKILMWTHDVDNQYFTFPAQPFLTYHNKRSSVIDRFTPNDVKAIIEGLLLHPAAHMHLKSPIDNHAIRVGGGIDNPFQFLFHLRYQLCPFPQKREAERDRLIVLFSEAIKDNTPITAHRLMAQP